MSETSPKAARDAVAWRPLPSRPPPPTMVGALGWMRENLFSSFFNGFLTFASLAFLYFTIPPLLNWMLFDAAFGDTRASCAGAGGACWSVVIARWDQLMYGFYPEAEHWRPNLAFCLLLAALYYGLYDGAPGRKYGLTFCAAFPFIAYWLLYGGFGGLPFVESAKWGGLLLTITMGVTGIAVSIPLGVLLALGRRSQMPVISAMCVVFIEYIRGVPLICILFFSNIALPLFLPEGVTIDGYLRAVVGMCLFASGYMAEVIRGGLQAIPRGQHEAGDALGMGYWKTTAFIVLPQALKISIPGVVNTSIALYKETTLVALVGIFDLLGVSRAIVADQEWLGLDVDLYVFIAVGFFIFCFSMSRYSLWLEKRLSHGEER